MDKQHSDAPDTIIGRFDGEPGRDLLMEVLCRQFLFQGEARLCKKIMDVGELLELAPGTVLINQDGSDNDLFLVLGGELSIVVNGRNVATRVSGQHVGEMSLLDCTARRSATVIARERSLILKINERAFAALATEYPQLWKRIALELSQRLKQRNRFLIAPRNQPVMFVGSSSEGLSLAREIQSGLSHDPLVVTVWPDGVFRPSSTTIEDLIHVAKNSDFGVMVITPDDHVSIRNSVFDAPRDNVIFELGLFVGTIGRERTFIVKQRGADVRIPSDLLGVKTIDFAQGEPLSTQVRMASVCHELRKLFTELGPL